MKIYNHDRPYKIFQKIKYHDAKDVLNLLLSP